MSAARLLALICLLAVACGVVAQQPDPQSSYEPRSQPGAGQKFLEKFVGTWDVDKTFYPRSGDPAKSKGECRQTMINAGRFLQSEFTFGEGDRKSTGVGIIGFEAETGKFTSVWMDSRRTSMSFRQSPDKFNGDEIVLVSQSLGEEKATRRTRTVTRLEDGGRKIVHRQYAAAEDGKERLMMELVLTRKGDAAPSKR